MNTSVADIFDMAPVGLDDRPHSLKEYRGRVVLVVNTASACGFTPQMKALEKLYAKREAAGFAVLGFPSNDFNQEPLAPKALATEFCERYAVTFPLFGVTHVKGPAQHPLFQRLTEASPGLLGRNILWNFEKFLVDHEGTLIGRWRSVTSPAGRRIAGAVDAALARRGGG